MNAMREVALKPNVGDKIRLTGGLTSYEVVDHVFGPCGGQPDSRVVPARRTELRKPDGIDGTFVEQVWTGSVPLPVWSDLVSRAATVERAHVALSGPKLSG